MVGNSSGLCVRLGFVNVVSGVVFLPPVVCESLVFCEALRSGVWRVV